jgi:hypothetical protein
MIDPVEDPQRPHDAKPPVALPVAMERLGLCRLRIARQTEHGTRDRTPEALWPSSQFSLGILAVIKGIRHRSVAEILQPEPGVNPDAGYPALVAAPPDRGNVLRLLTEIAIARGQGHDQVASPAPRREEPRGDRALDGGRGAAHECRGLLDGQQAARSYFTLRLAPRDRNPERAGPAGSADADPGHCDTV